jgi:hypothetical protein
LGENTGDSKGRRAFVALVRVDETNSGGDFLIVNLQMVTRVEGRNFKDEQDKHQGRVFFSDGGSVNLVGADADRVIAALEDFAGYPRI